MLFSHSHCLCTIYSSGPGSFLFFLLACLFMYCVHTLHRVPLQKPPPPPPFNVTADCDHKTPTLLIILVSFKDYTCRCIGLLVPLFLCCLVRNKDDDSLCSVRKVHLLKSWASLGLATVHCSCVSKIGEREGWLLLGCQFCLEAGTKYLHI